VNNTRTILTEPERRLRRTADDVQSAIGQLTDSYDQPGALRLLKALGDCDAFVAPALSYLRTPEQEHVRRDFH
jgi:hypothetical protein